MKKQEFNSFLKQIGVLSDLQLEQLESMIKANTTGNSFLSQVNRFKQLSTCPHCSSNLMVKFGFTKGQQRYKCKSCNKTSTPLTNTPLSKLHHKEKMLLYAKCMIERKTIRQSAKECNIAIATSFKWRHAFLKKASNHQAINMSGVVELDEVYFLRSHKGDREISRKPRKRGGKAKKRGLSKEQVPVLTGILRGQSFVIDKVLHNGMKAKTVRKILSPALDQNNSIVCADKHSVFKSLSKTISVTMKLFDSYKHIDVNDRAVHVQTANSYHSDLKSWINIKMKGVATKYLHNYMTWKRIFYWFRDEIKPIHVLYEAMGLQRINMKL